MEQSVNIFSKLQEYEVKPPDSLYKNVVKSLSEEAEKNLAENFAKLQLHEENPPSHLFAAIWKKINKSQKGKLVVFNWKYAAAASVVLALGVWGLVSKLNNKENGEGFAIQEPKTIVETPQSPTVSKDSSTINIAPKVVNKNQHINSIAKTKIKNPNTKIGVQENLIAIGDDQYDVPQNDYYAFLTGFNYNNVPNFIKNPSGESVAIAVDQSTSINMSAPMVKMVKSMYSTRRNGKLTNRAKRVKKKLVNWQNADKNFFDKNLDKNPLNPVDVGELIF